MSSRVCPKSGCVADQLAVDDVGESSFEAAQHFSVAFAGGAFSPVDRHFQAAYSQDVKAFGGGGSTARQLAPIEVLITKNGSPAAMLVGFDEWESLQETLYWLSQPGIRDAVAEADADIAAGRTYSEGDIRAEFGAPRRRP